MGITLEEAEKIAENIPRVLFSVSCVTSASSSWDSGKLVTIQEVREYSKTWPIATGGSSGWLGLYIKPVFHSVQESE